RTMTMPNAKCQMTNDKSRRTHKIMPFVKLVVIGERPVLRSILLMTLMFAGLSLFAGQAGETPPAPNPNPPPIDVLFYFSKRDTHLPATEKALADAVKQMPQIKINRVSIDDKDGYAQFAAEEK